MNWLKDGTNIIVGNVYEGDSDYRLRSGMIIEKINGKNTSDVQMQDGILI